MFQNMKTSVDNIFAAGDIAQFPMFLCGDQQINIQHWQMAHAHGNLINNYIIQRK